MHKLHLRLHIYIVVLYIHCTFFRSRCHVNLKRSINQSIYFSRRSTK